MNFTASSTDGRRIAYDTIGSGPAVVLVPGALSVAADYSRFANALARHGFTVHTIERRGRGLSCDQGDGYSIRTEVDDVSALLKQTGSRLLVGHSYGGLIALEVAAVTPTLAAVAVYEPGVSIDGDIPAGWIGEAQRQFDDGDAAGAFITFIKAMNPASRRTPDLMLRAILPIAMGRSSWKQHRTLMGTALNEHREVARLDDTYAKYAAIGADVLLMYGGRDAGPGRENRHRLAGVMPSATVHDFPDLDHFGLSEKDPEAVAATAAAFLATLPAPERQ